jgi:hypothetical protein
MGVHKSVPLRIVVMYWHIFDVKIVSFSLFQKEGSFTCHWLVVCVGVGIGVNGKAGNQG